MRRQRAHAWFAFLKVFADNYMRIMMLRELCVPAFLSLLGWQGSTTSNFSIFLWRLVYNDYEKMRLAESPYFLL